MESLKHIAALAEQGVGVVAIVALLVVVFYCLSHIRDMTKNHREAQKEERGEFLKTIEKLQNRQIEAQRKSDDRADLRSKQSDLVIESLKDTIRGTMFRGEK